MTAQQILDTVRPLLSDEIVPFRFSPDELFRHMSEGQREIERRHPESMYVDAVTITRPVDIKNKDQEFEIRDVYFMAVVDFVLYRALSKDAESTTNMQLANDYRSKFATELM